MQLLMLLEAVDPVAHEEEKGSKTQKKAMLFALIEQAAEFFVFGFPSSRAFRTRIDLAAVLYSTRESRAGCVPAIQ